MNKVQSKRLLNVARALREAHAAKKAFDMERLVFGHRNQVEFDEEQGKTVQTDDANFCGTPACALGHYAARTDLQRILKISIFKEKGAPAADVVYFGTKRKSVDYYDESIWADHFGLDDSYEMEELFGFAGCNEAKTALQAAKYIERFVQKKMYPGRRERRTEY
jgi:hypothetical protein